ncbi:hypothetical protein GCM10011369_05990 [Neiella marina]|uniref:Uncharacterized protein n=1 Tax=Neiella marina TaxID=508461 RepID=A0A8J2U2U5_9GAMM|nr:hypothetical protein [Neiella marina]GGA67156.1 hypothetical protein GCM10011369_05990 [Neiella marina]
MDEITKYHELAKDAGNRLRAYILSVSSGATGIFFLALTKTDKAPLSCSEKWLLSIALASFVLTVFLCLYELRIDAQRFFSLAKELGKPKAEQSWDKNEQFKSIRYWLIHMSYVTLGVAIVSTSLYLASKIVGT